VQVGDGLLTSGGGVGATGLVVGRTEEAALVLAAPAPAALDRQFAGWRGKRAADVVLSLLLVVLSLPLLAAIALAVKVTSRGPVLFRQRRVGMGGREFPILKFRTMRTDAQHRLQADPALYQLFLSGSHKIPCHLDPRVTRVGRILRRLSFDELPQLFNVLVGHMSLVGPRPVERSQLLRDYGGYEHSYLHLRPGLTGLWQVSGRSTVHFPQRAELDTHYLHRCGPWLDVKIIARTPLVIVTGLGAE
jgi:lipopolysaccharide/colanic/teichoic acid biosynthesis glycosyltransferase